jgi:multiple antibiotic resistance protein
MLSILHDFLLIFIPLFVVIDPAGAIPLFLAITDRYTEEQRRQVARRAARVAGLTGVLFVVLGQAILTFLGLKFEDFQIAGGLLLVILAVIDLLIPGKPAVDQVSMDPAGTVGVVPLAVPLIVGPATMTTSLLLVNTYSKRYDEHFGAPLGQVIVTAMVCAALLINIGALHVGMRYSNRIVAIVGKNTMAVVNKIVMILIAAIAVSLIRQGIEGIVRGLRQPPATVPVTAAFYDPRAG